MANDIKLNATKRVANGSGEARRIRREGGLPAAITRIDRTTETLKLNTHEFRMAMRGEINEKVLVELNLDGAQVHALIREIQRDVIDSTPIHLDFSEVDMTKKLRSSVRLILMGEPDGVRNQGGILTQACHDIEIECLPSKLIEKYEINIDALKAGESITVGDLNLGDDYVILTQAATPIALVSKPEEDPAAAAAAAAPAAKGKK